ISYDTQRERLIRRLDRPDKHWKFNIADLDERKRWSQYQQTFQEVLERSDTADAPWYVVPSDSKTYRNWAVAEIVRETLNDLDPRLPMSDLDIDVLKDRLAPPN